MDAPSIFSFNYMSCIFKFVACFVFENAEITEDENILKEGNTIV